MNKIPQMRFIVSVETRFSEFQDGGDSRHFAITSMRRNEGNRKRKYKFTHERFIRYGNMIRQLWHDGRAVPDFTRAHTWGIEPSFDPTYDPMSPEEGKWPYK